MDVTYSSDSCSSDSDTRDIWTIQLSYKRLTRDGLDEEVGQVPDKTANGISTVLLNNNVLTHIPVSIARFTSLRILDVSSNQLTTFPDELWQCPLSTLIAKNNKLTNESLPKSLLPLNDQLRELNLSGNAFTHFPDQLLELKSLKYLYLGANQIAMIPKEIRSMTNLHILSMPGNRLADVPESVGSLYYLQALILFDNAIKNIPASIAALTNLKSLFLHNNQLKHLPRDILQLKNLIELSLRDNPLVVRFVQDMTLNPPSLLELSARVLKNSEIQPQVTDLPRSLHDYLNNANCCVNPQCKGVFFDNRVEHIKFVDFCGKYRVPLMQYLCSSKCITSESSRRSDGQGASGYMMRKVLLG